MARKRKLKFDPQITKVKLHPEQAVLACQCWNTGLWGPNWQHSGSSSGCAFNGKYYVSFLTGAGATSS